MGREKHKNYFVIPTSFNLLFPGSRLSFRLIVDGHPKCANVAVFVALRSIILHWSESVSFKQPCDPLQIEFSSCLPLPLCNFRTASRQSPRPVHSLWNGSYIFRRVVNALMVWRNPIVVLTFSKFWPATRARGTPGRTTSAARVPAARRSAATS